MITDLFLRDRRGISLSDAERQGLDRSITDIRKLSAHATFRRAGEVSSESALLLEGFMSRYIDDHKGRRQLVGIHVPGEFVDLHTFPMHVLDHGIAALTNATLAIIPHAALDRQIGKTPGIARKLWFSTLIDAALHRAWLFRLGRLDAVGRVAHFVCEMNARLEIVDASDGRKFVLGLTQADLGEACGLTTVHTNRVVRHLREAGLCTFRASLVEIFDRKGLERRGDFDPFYLYIEKERVGSNA
jgi:CRP-like cAMP-binding protein